MDGSGGRTVDEERQSGRHRERRTSTFFQHDEGEDGLEFAAIDIPSGRTAVTTLSYLMRLANKMSM